MSAETKTRLEQSFGRMRAVAGSPEYRQILRASEEWWTRWAERRARRLAAEAAGEEPPGESFRDRCGRVNRERVKRYA